MCMKRYRVYLSKGKERQYIGTIAGKEVVRAVDKYADRLKQLTAIIETDGVYGIIVEEERDRADEEVEILVYDDGIGFEHARRLAMQGASVYYYVDWVDVYPRIEDYVIGTGFEDIGVVKVEDFGEVIDKVDCVMFTDFGFGALADRLRQKGIPAFGASKKAEMLEHDRVYMRKVFEELGINVPKYKVVKGINGVINYLRAHGGGKYVKVNRFRGNIETFKAYDVYQAEMLLNQSGFGIFGNDIEFVIEEECQGVEIGVDFFVTDEGIVRPYFFGFEIKNYGTLGKWVRESIWDEYFIEKIEDWLVKSGYRGGFSMEGFFDGEKIYCIDACARLPYSLSLLWGRHITNYVDLVYGIARGEYVEPKISSEGEYGCHIEIIVADTRLWQEIVLDGIDDNDVGFRAVVRRNGRYYYVPGDYVFANALGVGMTKEEAWTKAKYVADRIKGYEVYYDYAIIDHFKERLKQLEELGVRL